MKITCPRCAEIHDVPLPAPPAVAVNPCPCAQTASLRSTRFTYCPDCLLNPAATFVGVQTLFPDGDTSCAAGHPTRAWPAGFPYLPRAGQTRAERQGSYGQLFEVVSARAAGGGASYLLKVPRHTRYGKYHQSEGEVLQALDGLGFPLCVHVATFDPDGAHGGLPCFVMEEVQDAAWVTKWFADRPEYLAPAPGMPGRLLAETLVRIVEPLAEAHTRWQVVSTTGRSFAHRDLKPENILARQLEDEVSITVADLGSAVGLTAGATTGRPRSTLEYAGPEVVLLWAVNRGSVTKAGVRTLISAHPWLSTYPWVDEFLASTEDRIDTGGDVDPVDFVRADIHSVGLIAWRLVKNKMRWDADTPDPRFDRRVALTSHELGGNTRLAEVLDRCLEIDPSKRYPDYRELLKDLRAAIGTEVSSFVELRAALASAPPGYTVRLTAGLYQVDQTIVVPPYVTLEGSGTERATVLARSKELEGPVLRLGGHAAAEQVSVDVAMRTGALAVLWKNRERWESDPSRVAAVVLYPGAELKNATVHDFGAAVVVVPNGPGGSTSDAPARMVGPKLKTGCVGVWVVGGGSVSIEGGEVAETEFGVFASGSEARAVISAATVTRNRDGVRAGGGGTIQILDDVTVSSNRSMGLRSLAGGTITMNGGKLVANAGSGAQSEGSGAAIDLTGVAVLENAGFGLRVIAGKITMTGGRVHQNTGPGAQARGPGSRLELSGAVGVSDNEGWGIEADQGGFASADGGAIHCSRGGGVRCDGAGSEVKLTGGVSLVRERSEDKEQRIGLWASSTATVSSSGPPDRRGRIDGFTFGVAAVGGAVTLVDTDVVNSKNTGVVAQAGGSVSVTGGSLKSNGHAGAYSTGNDSNITLVGPITIADNGHEGLAAADGGTVNAADAEVSANLLEGVEARFGGKVTITKGRIQANKTDGVRVRGENSRAVLSGEVSVSENLGWAVHADEGGYASADGAQMKGNQRGGVLAKGPKTVVELSGAVDILESERIDAEAETFGIDAKSGASVSLVADAAHPASLTGYRFGAVADGKDARVVLRHVEFKGVRWSGLCAIRGGTVECTGGAVTECGHNGALAMHADSHITIDSLRVERNEFSGARVADGGELVVVDAMVTQNGYAGITSEGRGCAKVTRGVLRANAGGAVSAHGAGTRVEFFDVDIAEHAIASRAANDASVDVSGGQWTRNSTRSRGAVRGVAGGRVLLDHVACEDEPWVADADERSSVVLDTPLLIRSALNPWFRRRAAGVVDGPGSAVTWRRTCGRRLSAAPDQTALSVAQFATRRSRVWRGPRR